MKLIRHIALICVVVMAVVACSVSKHSYRGQNVKPNDAIAVQRDGVQQGTWQTFDMVIDYRYESEGGLLHLSGEAELGQHYQMVYDRVRYLWLYLFLTDADDVIVDSISMPVHIVSTEDRFSFSRTVKLADDVRGISFGYDGHAYEFDGHNYFYYP